MSVNLIDKFAASCENDDCVYVEREGKLVNLALSPADHKLPIVGVVMTPIQAFELAKNIMEASIRALRNE